MLSNVKLMSLCRNSSFRSLNSRNDVVLAVVRLHPSQLGALRALSSSSSCTSFIYSNKLSIPSTSSHFVSFRGVRGGRHHNEEASGESTDEGKKNEQKAESEEPGNSEKKQQPKIDPAQLRKLRIYVLIIASLSFVTSFLLLQQYSAGEGQNAAGLLPEHFTRTGIEFELFVQKYLKAGEVKRILFCPDNARAIVFLQDDAVMDGRKVADRVVVVAYPKTAQNFWADVRKEEAELGISLADGVKIDLHKGMTTLRLVEMILGIVIIAWLGTQYGRLMRKRILEIRASKAQSGSKGTKP